MYVIGTAGHVDHGKSALVQALTGIDPDRLREEKERGLTIDLGFAWLTLPNGEEVSIVDVPGHERFIKNMLAGVGGIDLALLVVAADEGVMPQTREHLAIIDLLGIEHGVVAVTKTDLVDADFAELVAADVEEALRGTTLEGAPTVVCSAVSRQGLDELVAALQTELVRTPAKRDIGRPRLPIDRAFTIAGFGTVVTGTLIAGSLRVGQEVEVAPAGLRARVRGLQAHGQKVEVAPPGRRTAVNLAGVAVEELERGMVVASPGWLRAATSLDVRLRAVRHLSRPLRHNTTVTLHTGSAEVEGRLLLLDSDQVPPGEEAWVQLRLSRPVAAVKGDRFVVRDPNDTLGGGRIVDTQARRHRRFHPPTIERLEAMDRGSPREAVLMAAAASEPVSLRDLSSGLDLSAEEVRAAVEEAIAGGELLALDGGPPADGTLLYTTVGFASLAERLKDVLSEYHRQFPLRRGISKEELRSRLGLESRAFDQAVALLAARSEVREAAGSVSLPGHEPRPDASQEERARQLLAALRSQPFSPPALDSDDDLLSYLEDRGDIVWVGEGIVFAAEAYREMVERVVAHLGERRTVTLAQVRDLLGTSRKYAQALLEHMDEQRLTRRVGDERVLRSPAR
ncbi:MAG: selenocysteine-specific translation elongation factor [Dehalococcoidia bacterium]|nr:selenocysteine-specific translation elongation factor [Dehalococcoidia bacterium]